MNDIITPVTADKEVGFDQFGQFVSWEGKQDHKIGTIIADVREKKCGLCGEGWQLNGPSLRNQFLMREVEEWVHKSCFLGYLKIQEKSRLYDALCKACGKVYESGTAVVSWRIKSIANEYGGAWNTPWYHISFTRLPVDGERRAKMRDEDRGSGTGFTLKFGPRKRVYHMSLHNPGFDFSKYHPMAPKDVTTGCREGEIMVHAWGWDDVAKHLDTIVKIVVENSSEP